MGKIVIGRIGAPHGLNGWVSVQSYTSPIENILNYRDWYLDGLDRTVQVAEFRQNGHKILVQLANVTDRDQAASLTNTKIMLEQAELQQLPADEFYWHDLIGMLVVTTTGQTLGVVGEMLNKGASDIMSVYQGKNEYLIPFVMRDIVTAVDLAAKQITVDWQE